jgi:hypothetical protein
MRRTRAMRVLAVVVGIVGMYRARQSGLGVRNIKGVLRSVLQGSVANLLQLWALAKKQIEA